MPASTISNATWMPWGRSSSAAALVIARTPNDPAAHRPRPAVARRVEPPVTCTRVAGRACLIANRPLADRNEKAARPAPLPTIKAVKVGLGNRTAAERPGASAAVCSGRVQHELDPSVSNGRPLQRAVHARGVGHISLQRERASRADAVQVLCDRATPATAQPSLTSSSMTARPRLRAPNTTALRC